MRKFSLPHPLPMYAGAQDHFQLFDSMTEFAETVGKFNAATEKYSTRAYETRTLEMVAAGGWAGGHGWKAALDMLRFGNAAHVAASDKFMTKLTDIVPPPAARHTIVDDVVGAFPNVPAFIAGQPMNMRRRVTREDENAPVVVVLNVGSSASISAQHVLQRGLAALALVRLLSSARPVELWAGVTCAGGRANSYSVYVRIETAPLDLQRAAHFIADPSTARLFCYPLLTRMGADDNIPWGRTQSEEGFHAAMRGGFPHASDIVGMPVLHAYDKATSRPVEWIKEKLAFLSVDDLGEAA